LHPILFEIFGYQVRSYSMAMATGFVVGILLLRRRAVYEQFDVNFVLNSALLTIFGTILGGRALFVITTWGERFADKPWYEIFKVWEGGLVFYGGFFGSILFVCLYAVVKRQNVLALMDLFAPYAGLGLAIHRPFGCFMNGCCFGAPTGMPWGVHYPVDAYATKFYGIGQALHPTQLYMGLNGLFLFLVLRWYRDKKRSHGEVFGLLLSIYAINRFIIEFFRGDKIRGFVTGDAVWGLLVFIVGLTVFLLAKKLANKPLRNAGWLVILVGVVLAYLSLYSDTIHAGAETPFSTSQFIGFYTLAAGLTIFLNARLFGPPIQPEYGQPLAPGTLVEKVEAQAEAVAE